MAWRDVVIEKIGTTVTWTVDGLLIATVPIDGITFGGEDIVFGMFDINSWLPQVQNTKLRSGAPNVLGAAS